MDLDCLKVFKKFRDIIRQSWGSPRITGEETRLVFMLGSTHDDSVQREIEMESREHRDIVQGNFLDTYKNLTYKSVMGHLWVSEHCESAEWVVKSDDDIYTDLYALLHTLRETLVTPDHRARYDEGRFMLGAVNHVYTEIIRSSEHRWNKWVVTYDEWPRDEVIFSDIIIIISSVLGEVSWQH